jgi:putative membrane protein
MSRTLDSNNQTPDRQGIVTDLVTICRGGLMGAADIVPGVSGGTVALVVGIYSRLVTAISHVDGQFVSLVKSRKWGEAARHVDLRFLLGLGVGIGLGAITLGSFIERLLTGEQSREITLSIFLGMILASTLIVVQLISVKSSQSRIVCLVLGLGAALFAYNLTGMTAYGPATSMPYIFLCGMIGICAMILPGISGAYLLIVLGFYPQLTDILHRLKDGDIHLADLITIGAFGAGCLVGIIAFSKFLQWLLAHHMSRTMAVLAGFMLGATRKIWPFQLDTTPGELKLKHKVFEPFMPEFDGRFWLCILAAAGAFAIVLVVDRFARTDRSRV